MIASRYMHRSGHLCGNMYVCECVYTCVYVLERGHRKSGRYDYSVCAQVD